VEWVTLDRDCTDKELELLRMFANGMTFADAAVEWQISERQVRRRAEVLFAKLDARNPQHAVGVGFKRGLLEKDAVKLPPHLAGLQCTNLELEVFNLINLGFSDPDICFELEISRPALRNCRSRVCLKIGNDDPIWVATELRTNGFI
jgi:DNA-binding NarL/FixJ family response regulator